MVALLTPLRVFAIAAALCAPTLAVHAQERQAIARGHEIAERACAGCHVMDGGQGGIIQGTNVPSFTAIASRPDWTRERLQAFIMTPHRPMPGIPMGLPEINDLVAYIRSLK